MRNPPGVADVGAGPRPAKGVGVLRVVTTSTAVTLPRAVGCSAATVLVAALPTVSVTEALVPAFAGASAAAPVMPSVVVSVMAAPAMASAVVLAMATPVMVALLVPVVPVLVAAEVASVTAVHAHAVGRSGGGRSPRSRVPIPKRGRAGSVYGC